MGPLGVCTDTEGLLGITTAGSHGTLSTSFPSVFSEDLTVLEAVTFQGLTVYLDVGLCHALLGVCFPLWTLWLSTLAWEPAQASYTAL